MGRVGPSARTQEQSAAAFTVLRHVVTHCATRADGAMLSAAWYDVFPGARIPVELIEGRAPRLFAWLVRDGQVLQTREGRRTFFAPADAAGLPLPAPELDQPRVFGAVVVAHGEAAARALAFAERARGRDVIGKEIAACWSAANGAPPPPSVIGRISRAMEPLIASGRVATRQDELHVYYRTVVSPRHAADAADAACAATHGTASPSPADRWPSDLMRVEEAARLTIASCESAVPLDRIAAQSEQDPALQLRGRTPLAVLVHRLLHTGRLLSVHPRIIPRSTPKRTRYFTVPGGPTRVRVAELTNADRRLAAVYGLWRATGRPATTAAFRVYADDRETLAIADDPSTGWVNTLREWTHQGIIVCFAGDAGRFLRWAPADEWARLSCDDQAERLGDPMGRFQRFPMRVYNAQMDEAQVHDAQWDDAQVHDAPVHDACAGSTSTSVAHDSLRGVQSMPEYLDGDVLDAHASGAMDDTVPDGAQMPPSASDGAVPDVAQTERQGGATAIASHVAAEGRDGAVNQAAAPPTHDVAFLSIAANMRTLVAAAKAARAQAYRHAHPTDERGAALVARRPVVLDDVRRAASDLPQFAPHRRSIANALTEATRLRPGMVRSWVVKVGVVGYSAYFDIPEGHGSSAAAESYAYVALERALACAMPDTLATDAERLRDAIYRDTLGTMPLGPHLLGARISALHRAITARIALIERAQASLELTTDEAHRVGAMRDQLRAVVDSVVASATMAGTPGALLAVEVTSVALQDATLAETVPMEPIPMDTIPMDDDGLPIFGDAASWDVLVMDLDDAAAQTKGVTRYKVTDDRQAAARWVNTVAQVRPPLAFIEAQRLPGARRGGRQRHAYLDRPGFACYMTMRVADSMLASIAAKAYFTLGALRDPRPCIAALQDSTAKAIHRSALAALGMLDDPTSRAAVAAYLFAACTPGGSGAGTPGSPMAWLTGVLALAPKPFGGLATALSAEERRALEAATGVTDEETAQWATLVLRAWDAQWSRAQLLRL